MNGGAEFVIGGRDPEYNIRQYNENWELYERSNPKGLRGGLSPALRAENYGQILPRGSRILAISSGTGLDEAELRERGYAVTASDVVSHNIANLRARGFEARYFDANKDRIPRKKFDGVYSNLGIGIHIPPRALVRLMADCRNSLEDGRGFFASFLDGNGHERSPRNEGFKRDFVYYPQKRLEQICMQEGLDLKFLNRIIAFNGTVFWHVGGVFKKDYEGGSYGERNLHPFGDVFWTPESLFGGRNLTHELMEAQVKAELLQPEVIKKIRRLEDLFTRSIVDSAGELGRAINTIWADGLAGHDIGEVMQHAKKYLTKHTRGYLTEAAFAVCNNNGFANILTGTEPSWSLEIIAKHLKIDYLPSPQWETESETQFTGKLNGKVFYPKDNANPGRPAASYEDRLRSYLGPQFRRITIGIGHSPKDDNLLETTDYPVYAYADKDTVHAAHRRGGFTTADGQQIYAGHKPCLRWQHSEEIKELIGYLNSITSGRFPVEPDPEFKGRLWKCPDNTLNEDFYKANQTPVHIL